MEAKEQDSDDLLASRAVHCAQRSLDGAWQFVIVSDEIERSKISHLVDAERAALRALCPILVLTRPEALEFILMKRRESGE